MTHAPLGWTDESPHLLPDGSLLFIRTRETARKVKGEWVTTSRGLLEHLVSRKLVTVATVKFATTEGGGVWLNYYGHYNWADRVAISP